MDFRTADRAGTVTQRAAGNIRSTHSVWNLLRSSSSFAVTGGGQQWQHRFMSPNGAKPGS
ncbi:hypothetical protein I7I48_06192 [Histoplasma ohiense]|nr:hypothetical protein I7I48_06192 [Histoplasma ohiense (nom. inval.)]